MIKEVFVVLLVVVADGVIIDVNWNDEDAVFGDFVVDAGVCEWLLQLGIELSDDLVLE